MLYTRLLRVTNQARPCRLDIRYPVAPSIPFVARLQFAFEAAAFLFEVNPHESWRKLGKKPGGTHDANQVRDGKRDGNAIGHGRLVGRRQAEPGNRIARSSDGRGLGERARDDARGGARIVGEHAAHQVGHDESGRRDNCRERRLLKTVALQTAEKLRPCPESC